MDFERFPATFGILALTIVVSALGLTSMPKIIERNLLRPYWLLKNRAYSPIVTCGFIHGSFGHLFFNCLTLYFFGLHLEQRMHTPRFIALYAVGLVVSSLGTVYKHRADPNYSSLGASGAILAVLFASIVYDPTQMLYLYFAIPVPAVVFAFGYLAYSWWASRNKTGDRINHDAHMDGALAGVLFVMITDFEVWRQATHTIVRQFS
jgi:membrane associated rhomboid family serine protease